MVKWNLFKKPKRKQETATPVQTDTVQEQENTEPVQQSQKNEQDEDKPLAEYRETLKTGVPTTNQTSRSALGPNSEQRVWRDVGSIEKHIDQLNKTKKPVKKINELDKKVDKLINKVKEKKRKPSNVIYVVSKPQPGQVKGDWAVRSHGKIFSHHRTKENAIKEARKIAAEKEATVMVQNTDGTFSEGFKPRPKKKK